MEPKPIVVEARELTVRFGDFTAVDKVTFQVSRGEIFGFLGANGAGKTTTIRVLCGLLPPTEGAVSVCGLGFEDGGRGVKSKVGYMSQKFTLYDDLSVIENLEFTAALRKMTPAQLKVRSEELLSFIGFKSRLGTLVRDLPGGIKQQVSLAASLLHQPEVVFLDEPTAGVTPVSRERFWSLIRQLAAGGTTVFVTTHYMDEAEQCERIALMRSGKLIALDSPEGLKTSTFPSQLLELVPKSDQQPRELDSWRKNSAFSLFEPYGLRWHLEIKNPTIWQQLRPEIERNYDVHNIKPSLEDVFIRLVEGKKPDA